MTKLEEKKQKILDQIIKTGNQSLEDDLHNYLGRIKDEIEKLEGLAEAAEKKP